MKPEVLECRRPAPRLINAANCALAAISAALALFMAQLWTDALSGPGAQTAQRGARPPGEIQRRAASLSDYAGVEARLFGLDNPAPARLLAPKARPSQQAPAVPVPPAAPPLPNPPPRIRLLGTLLLDSGTAAIIEYPAGSGAGTHYRIGDRIEEFVVRAIRKDYVLLMRGSEELKVALNEESRSQPPSNGAFAEAPLRADGTPADIPPSLMPSKQAEPPAPVKRPARR